MSDEIGRYLTLVLGELGLKGRLFFTKMEVYQVLARYYGCGMSTARRYWSALVQEVTSPRGGLAASGRAQCYLGRRGVSRISYEDVVVIIETIEEGATSRRA